MRDLCPLSIAAAPLAAPSGENRVFRGEAAP